MSASTYTGSRWQVETRSTLRMAREDAERARELDEALASWIAARRTERRARERAEAQTDC